MNTRILTPGFRSAWTLLALVAVVIAMLFAAPAQTAHAEDTPPTNTQTPAPDDVDTPAPGSTGNALPYCEPESPGKPESNEAQAPSSPSPPTDTPAADASAAPSPEPTCIPIGAASEGTSYPARDVPDWPWITLVVTLVGGAIAWVFTRVIRAQQRTAALRRLAERP